MPPEGLGKWGSTGGPFTILAYPESFGERTTATIEAAPKAIFTFVPGAPPATGGGLSPEYPGSAYRWALLALAASATFAGVAAVLMIGARRQQ